MAATGDIVNEHGDLFFSERCPPLSEGRVTVSLFQALRALWFGWRLIEADDPDWVIIERGGLRWRHR